MKRNTWTICKLKLKSLKYNTIVVSIFPFLLQGCYPTYYVGSYKIPFYYIDFIKTISDTIRLIDTDSNLIAFTNYGKGTITNKDTIEFDEDQICCEQESFYSNYNCENNIFKILIGFEGMPCESQSISYTFEFKFRNSKNYEFYYSFGTFGYNDSIAYYNSSFYKDSLLRLIDNNYSQGKVISHSTLVIRKSIGFIWLILDNGERFYNADIPDSILRKYD